MSEIDLTSSVNTTAIADAEMRLAMLRRLASLGMRLAEEVCERGINSPYHPEAKHDPARAFAAVSRAVRLTLVLQVKMEADLVALRNGGAVSSPPAPAYRPDRASDTPAAADIAHGDRDDTPLDPARECLRERERFDAVLSRPFDDCVAAIRADLGLAAEDELPSLRSADVPSATDAASQADETSAFRVGALDPPNTG